MELYTPFIETTDDNRTPTSLLQKTTVQANEMWHSVAKTGKAEFKYTNEYNGKVMSETIYLTIKEKKNHLRLATYAGLDYRHLARYVTGMHLKDITAFLKHGIPDTGS